MLSFFYSIKKEDILSQLGELLKELKIFDFPNRRRIRIGSNNDGGYVLLDSGLESIDIVYSYGVGDNSDFEAMICEKYNALVAQYNNEAFGSTDTIPPRSTPKTIPK